MKIALLLVALAAACKAPKPPAPDAPPVPAVSAPADQNRVEKYVGGLQTDVKRAQEAKEKADAAVKKTQEAEKLPE